MLLVILMSLFGVLLRILIMIFWRGRLMQFEDWLRAIPCFYKNFSERGIFSRRVALAYFLSALAPSSVCAHCTGCHAPLFLLDIPCKNLPCPLVYKKELYFCHET